MLLSEDKGDQDSKFSHPDLWVMVRMGDIEFSDKSH